MLAGLGFKVQAIFNCSLSDMSRARLETLIKVIRKAQASARGSEKRKEKKAGSPEIRRSLPVPTAYICCS